MIVHVFSWVLKFNYQWTVVYIPPWFQIHHCSLCQFGTLMLNPAWRFHVMFSLLQRDGLVLFVRYGVCPCGVRAQQAVRRPRLPTCDRPRLVMGHRPLAAAAPWSPSSRTNSAARLWRMWRVRLSPYHRSVPASGLSALVQIMAWRWSGDKPLFEPMCWSGDKPLSEPMMVKE